MRLLEEGLAALLWGASEMSEPSIAQTATWQPPLNDIWAWYSQCEDLATAQAEEGAAVSPSSAIRLAVLLWGEAFTYDTGGRCSKKSFPRQLRTSQRHETIFNALKAARVDYDAFGVTGVCTEPGVGPFAGAAVLSYWYKEHMRRPMVVPSVPAGTDEGRNMLLHLVAIIHEFQVNNPANSHYSHVMFLRWDRMPVFDPCVLAYDAVIQSPEKTSLVLPWRLLEQWRCLVTDEPWLTPTSPCAATAVAHGSSGSSSRQDAPTLVGTNATSIQCWAAQCDAADVYCVAAFEAQDMRSGVTPLQKLRIPPDCDARRREARDSAEPPAERTPPFAMDELLHGVNFTVHRLNYDIGFMVKTVKPKPSKAPSKKSTSGAKKSTSKPDRKRR